MGIMGYKEDLDATISQMRMYIEQNKPYLFASLWQVFVEQSRRCDMNHVDRQDTTDICRYYEDQNIEYII